ncbi:MAG: class I SAM-dependent DNA methyltransferase [Oscillospiraceae bacterium]
MKSYGPLAAWYDHLTTDVPYAVFVAFYESIFQQQGKKIHTILDLACGTGTLTCLLAERGYEMIAVDASPDMLSVAAKKAQASSCAVTPLFLCQDLEELDLYGTVHCAVSSLDSINYIPPEALSEIFHRLHLFIEPGGLLIFDINSPERLRSLAGQAFVDETDGLLCLWRAELDEEETVLFYGMDLFTQEETGLWSREEEEHLEYIHEPAVLRHCLEQAGFGKITVRQDGPQHELGRMFLIAENGKD